MRRSRCAVFWMALGLLTLEGCASWSSLPPNSQPYFAVPPGDTKNFLGLAKKQDGLIARCAEQNSCDHAYFTRALIGLYESRETASKYFQKVIAVAPKGQLAVTSKLWLQLLQQHPFVSERTWFDSVMAAPAISDSQITLGKTSDRLVRDLLNREVIIQQLRSVQDTDAQALEFLRRELAERERKMDALNDKKDSSKVQADPATVQSLQKQLSERDKKIDELSSQLEALKRIDQEMREKVRPIRPPSTVLPPPTLEPANP